MAKHNNSLSKYTFFACLVLLLALSFLIVSKFVLTILSALVAVYVFYPLYEWLHKHIHSKNLSALLMTLFLIMLIALPLVIFVGIVTPEVNAYYSRITAILSSGDVSSIRDCVDGIPCESYRSLWALADSPSVRTELQNVLARGTSYVLAISSDALFSLPRIILQGFLLIFVIFFAFKDGKHAVQGFFELLPLKEKFKADLARQTSDVIYAAVYGNIVIAFIQGAVAMIGFFIFGLQAPVFWGLITVLAALIPFIGTALIWAPASIGMVTLGYLQHDSTHIWQGIGLFLYGALLIGTVDNFLKPKLISSRARVHPLLIFIGLVGGISVFGFVGLIIGPLTLALLWTFIEVYRRDKDEIIG